MTQPSLPSSTRVALRPALELAAVFALITFLVHFLSSLWGSHLGYGYFRDELYFLVCGRHLAWGYVDQPPLVALQARAAELLFGLSPTGVRVFSFLATSSTVGLTGVLAWQLGGRRPAQALAMTCVLAAPVFLGTGNYLSMNSFEPCFWMGCMLILVRIADGSSSPRAWLLFGVLAGLGIENKHSTVFFLIAVVLGLLLSALRQILFSRYCAGAAVILIVIALPNLLWQIANHFPTYEFLRNVAQSDKNLHHPPLDFLYEQIKVLLFSTAPLWIGGIVWFAFSRNSRPWRFVALIYLCFLAMMMAMHAKHYYLAPIYPVLFAAGAVGLSQLARRDWPVFTYAAVIGIGLLIGTGPVVLTILPPGRYAAYTRYFFTDSVRMEKYTSPLPQILSDRFGWPQMVEGFANRYNALPASERAQTAIFCGNYGEAGAVTILGSKYGLPAAISGHQNFFFWGWGGFAGESVLTLGNNAKDYTDLYGEVIDLGPFDAPWIMDHEHHHYFWLRHRKVPYAKAWPGLKSWN